MAAPSFECLEVKAPGADGVGQLVLNRPAKSNAIDQAMWSSLQPALDWLVGAGARCIVVSGAGKNFCAGIDLASLMGELAPQPGGGSNSGSGSSSQPSSSGRNGGADDTDACAGRARYHFRHAAGQRPQCGHAAGSLADVPLPRCHRIPPCWLALLPLVQPAPPRAHAVQAVRLCSPGGNELV